MKQDKGKENQKRKQKNLTNPMACHYEPECYSMKLVKWEFRRIAHPLRITMLPQVDIYFRFICRFTRRRHPSLRISVRRSLLQFSCYTQTIEALAQRLRRLLPSPADVVEIADHAIGEARQIVKARPKGPIDLDLYFGISEH